MLRSVLICALAAYAAAEAEWMEAFEVNDNEHTWVAQKVGGDYADPTMWLIMIPTTNPTKDEVAAQEGVADTLSECAPHEGDDHDDHDHRKARKLEDCECHVVHSGDEMHPQPGGSCFILTFDADSDDSTWPVDTTGLTGLLMYAQHVPTEFERDMHYWKDSAGVDIEPVEYPARWGGAIIASLLVNLMTLCGVILMIPAIGGLAKSKPDFFNASANAFAAGALISAAFYLMLFEGSHYVNLPTTEEAQESFIWGTTVLVGVITASVLDLIVMAVTGAKAPETATKDVEGAVTVVGMDKTTRVRCGVLIGDFMHNFCDGIFIGTAFLACSTSLAWNITVATIAHEIAQEISDFIVLTDPLQGNLTPKIALALNFASGFSVLLGAIIMMAIGEVSNLTIGVILTFGGGIYIQIGLAECMARVYSVANTVAVKVTAIVFFILGAIAIGLVLISHEHCNPGGHDHGGH